jgi:hypothetical protein
MPQPHGWLPLKGAPAVGGVMATGRCCPSRQASIPIGAVRVGVVVQREGLVPTILGMGAVYLLVTPGMLVNGRFASQMDVLEPRPDTSPWSSNAAAHALDLHVASPHSVIHPTQASTLSST